MKQLWLMLVVMLLGVPAGMAQGSKGEQPPADAMWTIHCQSFTGAYRVDLANRKRDAVKKLTGWNEWFIIHQEGADGESALYYGYFKAPPDRDLVGGDAKEVQKARESLRRVRALRDTDQQPLFPFSFACEIPRPGSEGPAQYDIRNAPPDRYWSLIIGEYRDNPDRKKAAVQAVELLRKEGTEAYYLHGPTSSLVCVGAWPRSAIKEQEADSAAPTDPDTVVKVYNFPLPKNAVTEYYGKDGRHYKVFAPKVDIQDPRMRAAVDMHPYFHTNGEVLGKRVKRPNGKQELMPDPSQLMFIPRKGQPPAEGEPKAGATDAQEPPLPRPIGPVRPKQEPGTGKLKSLD